MASASKRRLSWLLGRLQRLPRGPILGRGCALASGASVAAASPVRRQHPLRNLLSAVVLAPAFFLAACAGGGNGAGAAEPFFIVSCSLGCGATSSAEQAPLGCAVTGVALNEEVVIEFSSPVDLGSVNARSFSITDIGSGTSPVGSFVLDPNNPRRLRFRATLSFDSLGQPIYGLVAGRTYAIYLPGSAQDSGPDFVRSTAGAANATPFSCSVRALDELRDVASGAPRVDVFFDVATELDPSTGAVVGVAKEQLANAGTLLRDVYRGTEIKCVFDDIIDPATLVNPINGLTNTIAIEIDADGDAATSGDRVAVAGSYLLAFDFLERTTTLRFQPFAELPSSGPDPQSPRLLAFELRDGIKDLGGNSLSNAEVVLGVPEFRSLPPTVLPGGSGEDFSDSLERDPLRSGALWGPNGLAPGSGGGSGRLGDFDTAANAELATDSGPILLDTDGQLFKPPHIIAEYDPVTGMPGDAEILVDDGIFEFAHFRVGAGSSVRVIGSKPARIFSRGTLVIDGIVDASGEDVPIRQSMPCDPLDASIPFSCDFVGPLEPEDFLGGAGGSPGPAGGVGGRGGDLPDSDPTLVAVGGLDNPNAVIVTQGQDGGGIPFPDALAPTEYVGGGGGGVQWPDALPTNASDVGSFVWDIFICVSSQLGGSGAGGGYATPGAPGLTGSSQIFNPSQPPEALGGDLTGALDPLVRELAPERGHLRGGAGGGGGGAHAAQSRNQSTFIPCLPALAIGLYRPSIGNGGGGGGGAIELHAGASVHLTGSVLANGGRGGGVIRIPLGTQVGAMERISPGGGGAGGAILLRSEQLEIEPIPERLQVRGGPGGLGVEDPTPDDTIINFSLGGDGGAGFVRIETGSDVGLEAFSDLLAPTALELPELLGSPVLEDLLSVGPFVPRESGPEARSGAQSCWTQPPGNPFLIRFPADGPESASAGAEELGLGELSWDMEVEIAGVGPVSWRTPGALFPGGSLEELLGSDLGSAPLIVRFQGARTLEPIFDRCNVALTGPDSPLFGGSVTPWVRHPAELNGISGSAAANPNLLRYQIVFDPNDPFFPMIERVSRIRIRAVPE